MKMRKGRIRWLCKDRWSAWYDLGTPMPKELKQLSEVIAVEVQEEMTKEEYLKYFEIHEMTFNEPTGGHR